MSEELDLRALRAIAEAATPGPWGKIDSEHPDDRLITCLNAELLAARDGLPYFIGGFADPEDGEFIAAFNPATCLALIDRIVGWQDKPHITKGE